jgi:hypothetical protein
MPLTPPPSVVVPFGADALPPYITPVIPIESQISVEGGRASYETGFPPLCMTPKVEGGIPPFGADANGILYALSAQIAWLAAGAPSVWNEDVVTEVGGYPEGAILRNATDPSSFWYSLVDDNTNDPDSDPTDWVGFSPMSAPTGVQNEVIGNTPDDVALEPGVGFVDLDPTAGAGEVTDFTGGFDGQIIVVSNVHATNPVTIATGSGIRMSDPLTLLQYNSVSLRFSASLNVWVPMS